MKILFASTLLAALAITGCATTPPIQNPSGQLVKFTAPTIGKGAMEGAKYVLLEKSIADGRYTVVSMSSTRQPIANERQERIAFNAALTAFAPDFTDIAFRTYVDEGNYNQATVITTCDDFPLKTRQYSPCNSAFGDVFVPTGVTKRYVAGQMSADAMKQFNDPTRNRSRYVTTPQYVLAEAGVFARLAELAAVK